MKNTEGGIETVSTSYSKPKLLSSDDGINVFGTSDSEGRNRIVVLDSQHTTDWYQGKNISWLDISGGENKRKISDVSGNKSDPIPEKRVRVEFSSKNFEKFSKSDPDKWILVDKSGANEKVISSDEMPIIWSTNGNATLYEVKTSSGIRGIVRVEGTNNTGWEQNKNIFWTSGD